MTVPSVGKGEGKLEFSYITEQVQIGKNTLENDLTVPIRTKHLHMTQQFHSKVHIQKITGTPKKKTMCKTCTRFVPAPNGNNPNSSKPKEQTAI